jgi:hypothetical protein
MAYQRSLNSKLGKLRHGPLRYFRLDKKYQT